jgi:5-methyltetrahydropteroyltriglutamate--homocysteine methyltransferase
MPNSKHYRADHVGSLLRPQGLLEARRRLGAGMIDEDELREVENEAIAKAVELQLESGVDVVTDGEFRRLDFRTGFVDAFEGITMSKHERPWHGDGGEVTTLISRQFSISGKLAQRRRISEGEAAYLKTLTTAPVKVTLIAPSFLMSRFWEDGVTDNAYGSKEELGEELAAFTRKEIEALVAEGVEYVQLDNPAYAAFLDPDSLDRARTAGNDPEAALQLMLDVDAAAVEGIELPGPRFAIGMHVCRGNNQSLWLNEGAYDPIAEKLFQLPVDRFLLEYDDERSGGFAPLQYVPEGKIVVLGLVSSKKPELESFDELQARIDEAAEYLDIDYLALSPQCGFASVSDGGNHMSADEQYAKLQLVSDVALASWGIVL